MRRVALFALCLWAGGAQALQLHLLPPKSTDVALWRAAGFAVSQRGDLMVAVGEDGREAPQAAFALEIPAGLAPFARAVHEADEVLPDPLPGGAQWIVRGEQLELFAADPARLRELETLHGIQLSPPPRGARVGRTLELRAGKTDAATKQAIVDAVSGPSMEAYLTDLINGVGDRYSYRVGDELAAIHLQGVLQGLGYTVQMQHWTWQAPHEADNVIAIKTGSVYPDQIVVVGAHYDATSFKDNVDGPALGAEDNGSGSSALLHLAEILAGYQSEYTIHFVLFAAEEQGLLGSKYYVQQAVANGDDIVAALIMDMVAAWKLNYRMTSEGWTAAHGDPGSKVLMDLLVANAAQYSPNLETTQYAPGFGSDHAPFHDAGIPAVLAIETDYAIYSGYHRTTDTLDNPDLDFEFAEKVVRAVAGTLVDLTAPSTVPVALSGLRATQDAAKVRLQWTTALSGDATLQLTRTQADGRERTIATLAAADGPMEFVDELQNAAEGELIRYELRSGEGASASTTLRYRASSMLALEQNRPNPFRASEGTSIALTLGRSGPVTLAVYDVAGRRVRDLFDGELAAGLTQLHWDGADQSGHAVASGIYFYRLRAGDRLLTKRLTVLR